MNTTSVTSAPARGDYMRTADRRLVPFLWVAHMLNSFDRTKIASPHVSAPSPREASESGAGRPPAVRESLFDPPKANGEVQDGHPLKPLSYLGAHDGWLVTGHGLARAAGAEFATAREAVAR